jgi:tetratricopeptide (TPR) repeat protein
VAALILATLLYAQPSFGTQATGFEEAGALKDAGACDEAAALYASIAEDPATDSSLRNSARYNQAVCLELLGLFDQATAMYATIIDSSSDRSLGRDALFRIGMVEALRGDSSGARLRFRALLRGPRDRADRARLHIQLGTLDLEAGRPRRAARHLLRAQRLLAAAASAPESWFAAQHQVALGDLYVEAASRLKVDYGRPQRIVKRLAKRGKLLERAQQHYAAAIREHQPTWMQAATLHLGRALLAMSTEMDTGAQRLRAAAPARRSSDFDHLARWLSREGPSMARKAHESFRLCVDVTTETGSITRFGPQCRKQLEHFPMDLLVGPDAAP